MPNKDNQHTLPMYATPQENLESQTIRDKDISFEATGVYDSISVTAPGQFSHLHHLLSTVAEKPTKLRQQRNKWVMDALGIFLLSSPVENLPVLF